MRRPIPGFTTTVLPELVHNLQKTNLDAVKRHTVRVLQHIAVPEELQGTLAGICFKYLAAKESVAIRVFSMTVLANLAQQQPDLRNELCLLLEDQLPYASPAFTVRANKLLPKLKKTANLFVRFAGERD